MDTHTAMTPVVLVHGFNHDPRRPGPHHPETHPYPRWREMLGRPDAVGFEWFSRPGPLDAWAHGRWNRYRRAWDLAGTAADRLRVMLLNLPEPADILCHSLGSRVVLRALMSTRPGVARRVLILNGADYSRNGDVAARVCTEVQFYNVVVPADDVISKLARFAPGAGTDFLGNRGALYAATNWQDIDLGGGGDNPDDMGDHHYSYENPANWPVYRAIFKG